MAGCSTGSVCGRSGKGLLAVPSKMRLDSRVTALFVKDQYSAN